MKYLVSTKWTCSQIVYRTSKIPTMMKNSFQIELFPDEILLEIYQYLHCGHVLYSFYNLNLRLNRTIINYCQYVILRRLTYQQFRYLYSNILPKIGHCIRSLTINRLQQQEFLENFTLNIKNIFPNLEILAIDDWKNVDLFPFINNHLTKLEYLRRIVIRGLRKSIEVNSFVNIIDDYNQLLEMISKNPQIETILFEPDCYSMTLFNTKKLSTIYSNLIQINLSLSTSNDLLYFAFLFPTIRRVNVIIEELLPIEQDIIPFQCLTHFSLDTMNSPSKLESVLTIFQLIPTVEYLSLVLLTEDDRLLYGKDLLCNTLSLKSFQYAVYFSSSVNYSFDPQEFLRSWKSLQIIYTINKDQKKTYILIHTVPYPSILLNLQSISSNKFGAKERDQVYNCIQYLYITQVKNLKETFAILQHCRKIQDLTIQIDENESIRSVPSNSEFTPFIVKLKRLKILSVSGLVDNWYHFKQLILSADNLSTLCLDVQCAIKLFEIDDKEIFFPGVIHLFLDGRKTNVKFTSEHIYQLARIFNRIHSLKIKYRNDDIIEGKTLGEILDYCKHLIVFSMNGQLSENIPTDDLSQWLMQHSFRLKKLEKNYQIQLIDDSIQIWL
ncbi:hypothetical protein I4U23_027889 [Adineta vaga]|nr:hypothetical protein I4U23_027889 [Adineta vaga]